MSKKLSVQGSVFNAVFGSELKVLVLCRAAVSDGEFVNVKLDDYKGKYVILFFYPKVSESLHPASIHRGCTAQ